MKVVSAADGHSVSDRLKREIRETNILEAVRFVIEIVGVVAVVVTLAFSYQSVERATSALEASNEQLSQVRYQTVYERQLDLWKLGVEHPEVAPYIVGGKRPSASPDIHKNPTEEEKSDGSRRLALSTALDFYNYAFILQAPLSKDGKPYRVLAFDPNKGRPDDVSVDDWESWVTWSWTIRYGFINAPGMCDLLRRSGYAYERDFSKQILDEPVCNEAPR